MTPSSLLHFTEALLWCALLFVSNAGYGAILLRLFGLRRPSVTLAATTGVGVVVFLGGCLNLLKAITTPILLVLILLGLLAAIFLRITIAEPYRIRPRSIKLFTDLKRIFDGELPARPRVPLVLEFPRDDKDPSKVIKET